jgi:hypothetical protein
MSRRIQRSPHNPRGALWDAPGSCSPLPGCRTLFFSSFFLEISSAIALRPLCAHGSGLGPESGTGRGVWVWVCVGVCVCVCARAAAPHRGAARPPTARTPPRTRRAFVASRWNTYAARRREAPSRTALAPTSHPSTSHPSTSSHQLPQSHQRRRNSQCSRRSAQQTKTGAMSNPAIAPSKEKICIPSHTPTHPSIHPLTHYSTNSHTLTYLPQLTPTHPVTPPTPLPPVL